jgi:hypothetical protein
MLAGVGLVTMDGPEQDDEDINCDDHLQNKKKKKNKVSVWAMLSIPTVWFSFSAFIVATMCNGFLSINLEPQAGPVLPSHHLHRPPGSPQLQPDSFLYRHLLRPQGRRQQPGQVPRLLHL